MSDNYTINRTYSIHTRHDEWLKRQRNASATLRDLIDRAMEEEEIEGEEITWERFTDSPLTDLLERADVLSALSQAYRFAAAEVRDTGHGRSPVSISLTAPQRAWVDRWGQLRRGARSRAVQALVQMGMKLIPDPLATAPAPAEGTYTPPRPERREVDGYGTYGDPGHQQINPPAPPPPGVVPTAPPPIPSFKPGVSS